MSRYITMVVCMFTVTADASADDLTVEKLKAMVISSAQANTISHIRYRVLQRKAKDGANELTTHHHKRYELWQSGTKVRVDSMELDKDGKSVHSVNYDHMRCINCIQEGFTTHYFFGKSPVKSERNDDPSVIEQRLLIYQDLRVLGHQWTPHVNWTTPVPSGFFETMLPRIAELKATWDVAQESWIARIEPNFFTLRVRKKYGNKVDLIESRDAKGEALRRVSTDYQQLPKGEWFAKSSTERIEYIDAGKKHSREETITVEEVQLDSPVDPEVFTYFGFHLKPDTQVYEPNAQRGVVKYWNGSEVADKPSWAGQRPPKDMIKMNAMPASASPQPSEPLPSANRWTYYLLAGALLAAGLMILFYRRTR